MKNYRNYIIIDLSVPIDPTSPSEPWPPKIKYFDHRSGTVEVKEKLGVKPEDLVYSHGLGWAYEEITAITHTGTHVDAPWHYHPISEGKRSKTIDEVPLDWFFGNGVVLDLRHKKPGELITVEDLKGALTKINYEIQPRDIVLIMTGCDKKIDSPEYFDQPGMSREAVLWLVEKGVKVIGIDAYGFDISFKDMEELYKKGAGGRIIWQAHFAGIDREYCHIEKLANLDKIPIPFGFTVACFPVKIFKATAAWCRAVAIVEKDKIEDEREIKILKEV